MADADKPEKGKGKGGKEADGGGAAKAAGGEGKPKGEGAKAKGDGGKPGMSRAKGGGKPTQKKAPPAERKEYKRTEPPRLRQLYDKEVRTRLREEFGYTNPMQVPRLVKITLNMGLGRAVATPKIMESAVEEMKLISGQAPVVTEAKKDIANFKLRAGHKIGVMVTLRRERMWEFLDRFINIALPRVRDFKGVSPKAFDGRGNYSLGVREQIIFPEIDYDNIDAVKGMNVTIVTTADTDEEGRALLRALGMPFRQPSAPAASAQTTAEGAHA